MRRIISLTLSVIMATAMCGQEKNIKVVKSLDGPPTVSGFIAALGGIDRYNIDSLVLNFDAGFEDAFYGVLRDCCEKGRLRGIDMTGCEEVQHIPSGAFMSSYINSSLHKVVPGTEVDIRMPLHYITLPKSLRTIGDNAFACSCLEQIDIPTLTVNIGNGAFSGCNELKNVVLRGNRRRLADTGNGFTGIRADAILQVPDGLGEYYRTADGWNVFCTVTERSDIYRAVDVTVGADKTLKEALGCYDRDVDSLTISGNISSDDMAFLKDNVLYGRLVDIDMTNSTLEDGELFSCYLNSLRMPKYMDEIFGGFLSASEVETLTLPESYGKICRTAFYQYKWFADSTLVIPEGCKKIEDYAFYNCMSLKMLVLPSTLEELQPFSLCHSYKPEWEEYAVDLYVNRMYPPLSSVYDHLGDEIDTNGKLGPFGCKYEAGSIVCPTRNYRLFVPVGAKQNYANDKHWSHMAEIIETPLLTGTADGIENVTATAGQSDKASAADGIYTLDGRCISRDASVRPAIKGLYLVRENGVTRKVLN